MFGQSNGILFYQWQDINFLIKLLCYKAFHYRWQKACTKCKPKRSIMNDLWNEWLMGKYCWRYLCWWKSVFYKVLSVSILQPAGKIRCNSISNHSSFTKHLLIKYNEQILLTTYRNIRMHVKYAIYNWNIRYAVNKEDHLQTVILQILQLRERTRENLNIVHIFKRDAKIWNRQMNNTLIFHSSCT